MNADLRQRVIQAAIDARERAYAPYSNFFVGAALHSSGGQIFTGCNIENASYGLTICAERTAVFSAVAAGQRKFDLLAIATLGGATPCGACRQVLAEFAPDLPVLLVDTAHPGEARETTVGDLLPGAFRFAPGKQ